MQNQKRIGLMYKGAALLAFKNAKCSFSLQRISKSTFSEAAIVTVIVYYYTGKCALQIYY